MAPHTRTLRQATCLLGLALALTGAVGSAAGQGGGFDWVTIGDPGNRDTMPGEVPQWPDLEIGGVDYEYRLLRTELTVEQHFEFVQAYWPYVPPEDRLFSAFTGHWIHAGGDMDDPQYYIVPGADRYPTSMSWRMAARLCNWLDNDKSSEPWAFEQGVYDTSTFTYNDDYTFNDQPTHDPDARFWIPTIDEYAKGTFWDPAKDGGAGGYWAYPHSSDVPPIPGAPWEGGETNAGIDHDVPFLDVGSYPWAASPWGLLDGSGGEKEWTEGIPPGDLDRFLHGTRQYEGFHDLFDRLDDWGANRPSGFPNGLRLASSIPAPGVSVLVTLGIGFALRRRRVQCSGTMLRRQRSR